MENICSRRLSNSDEKNCFQVDQKKLIKYRLNDIDQMEIKIHWLRFIKKMLLILSRQYFISSVSYCCYLDVIFKLQPADNWSRSNEKDNHQTS